MIVYLISSYQGINTGSGGHYYSLLQMAQEVSKIEDVLVISIGDREPEMFSNFEFARHINATMMSMLFKVKDVIGTIREYSSKDVKVIHGYDEHTVYLLRRLQRAFECEVVLTKCGGAPKKTLPSISKLIVFHSKDYEFYKDSLRFSKVYKISNRVKSTTFNYNRQSQLDEVYDDDCYNIVKIGRIGGYYYHTLKQSINLACLINKFKKVKLSFIGYLESSLYFDELMNYAKENGVALEIFCEPAFTKKASELVWGADIVVGTGRGAMEALSSRKLLFFPVKGTDLPCIFTDETAEFAMSNNFSERTELPDELKRYLDGSVIIDLLEDKKALNSSIDFGRKVFEKEYCVVTGARRVLEVYEDQVCNVRHRPSRWIDCELVPRTIVLSIKNAVRPLVVDYIEKARF